MNGPTFFEPRRVATETFVLPSALPIPGLGILTANAYLIRGRQPMLIDTGLPALTEPFMAALESLIEPKDLKWLYLTHTDADHVGSLRTVLTRAPTARLVTTFLGMGKLGLSEPLDPTRVRLLNPGERLDIGDRELLAIKPPSFDAPETTGLFDGTTGALFSSDSLGALIGSPHALASDLDANELREGLIAWAGIDAPWLHRLDNQRFEASLSELRALAPGLVLSSHLPPAYDMLDTLLGHLRLAKEAKAFVGPSQEALDQMLAAAA